MDMQGYALICEVMHGYTQLCMDMHGDAEIGMDMHGHTWMHVWRFYGNTSTVG